MKHLYHSLLIGTLISTHGSSISAEEQSEDEVVTYNQCKIYSRAASYAVISLMDAADVFDGLGEYREIFIMDDLEEQARERVIQGTVCEELCLKGHQYCKDFKRDLDEDEFEKMAMFKGLLKKKMDVVKPGMNVAKKMAKKMLGNAKDLSDEDIEEADVKLRKLIKENLNINKVADLVQMGLNKFNIPLQIKDVIKQDPKALFETGKKLYNSFKNAAGSNGEKSLDLSNLLPAAKEALSNMAAKYKEANPSLETNDEDFDDNIEHAAEFVEKDEL